MVDDLDAACHESSDPADGGPLMVSQLLQTANPGRPRIQIDRTFLEHALQMRGPTALSSIFKCSSRTVRRRALEMGLVQPGPAVRESITNTDGSISHHHTSSSAPVSDMSEAELDSRVGAILELFPTFGRRMITGHLRSGGHRIPRQRITDSYARVHGAPGSFGQRQIARKTYKVPGPNSLWHHDGQHGKGISN